MSVEITQYNPVKAEIEALKTTNASLVFIYDTPAGNKNARSHVFKLRQKKADVERVRVSAKADALDYGRKVDAIANELKGELESMIVVHQKPIDEIEARIAAEKAAKEKAEADAKAELERIERERQEAERAAEREAAAKQAAELAELKRQQEVERIQREAADRARIQAENNARAEREAAEARERAAIAAQQKAEKDKADAEIAAERAKIEAERQKIEAEKRAIQAKADAEAAAIRAAEKAKVDQAAAVQRALADKARQGQEARDATDRVNAEAAKREAGRMAKLAKANKVPKRIAKPDFSAVAKACEDYMAFISSEEFHPDRDNFNEKVFEAAMEAVYGAGVWAFVNAETKAA